MATHNTIRRPSATSASDPMAHSDDSNDYIRINRNTFNIIWPFNIPSNPEAGAIRIIKNLGDFGYFYTMFWWLVLFITLIPQRKVSLIYLVAMTYVTTLYLLVLRACPNSVVLHKILDKRAILFLLAVITSVELILTRAAIHLCVTLAATMPIILAHAVLWRRSEYVSDEAAGGELVPIVHDRDGEVNSSDAV